MDDEDVGWVVSETTITRTHLYPVKGDLGEDLSVDSQLWYEGIQEARLKPRGMIHNSGVTTVYRVEHLIGGVFY